MKIRSLYRSVAAATLAISSLTVVGCATFNASTPEQIVKQRATEYWKARAAGQLDKAYALSTPSYRKLRTEAQFKTKFGAGFNVESVDVTKVTCESEKCTAQVKLGVKPALMGLKIGTIDTYLDEVWLLEDGQWWYYQEL